MIYEDNDQEIPPRSAFGKKLFSYSIRFKFLGGILSRGILGCPDAEFFGLLLDQQIKLVPRFFQPRCAVGRTYLNRAKTYHHGTTILTTFCFR